MAIERILVAERDSAARGFILTALADWDCHIAVAADADEALVHASSLNFDLLLTAQGIAGDAWTPWLNRIRKASPDVLVVLLRTEAAELVPAEELASSFSILLKPLTREALFLLLERATQHSSLLAAARHLIEDAGTRQRRLWSLSRNR